VRAARRWCRGDRHLTGDAGGGVTRATAAGLRNIEFLEMDAEELRFGDDVLDAVTNAYGLMFCPDPRRASAKLHRVLKPGGRFALVTWDEPAKSPFFTLVSELAAQFLSLPPPDATAPGPVRLAPQEYWSLCEHRRLFRVSDRQSLDHVRM